MKEPVGQKIYTGEKVSSPRSAEISFLVQKTPRKTLASQAKKKDALARVVDEQRNSYLEMK